MSRHSDPTRIEAARRSAAIARLISAGESPDRAAAWVARWTATLGGPSSRADWERFEDWLARERTSGRARPPP